MSPFIENRGGKAAGGTPWPGSRPSRLRQGVSFAFFLFALGFLTPGCTRDWHYQPLGMWDRARLKPMEGSAAAPLLATTARPIPPGTAARGSTAPDDPTNTGRSGKTLLAKSPLPLTPALLARGQERFNVYCSPCHSRLGDGKGMIVQRGFPPPPDYAIARLRKAPVGHFFDVMTNGYGVMYSYADRVPVRDRWAIAGYIRVLQASRPEVPVEQGRELRERARETGVIDPTRGMRLPEEGGENNMRVPPPNPAPPGAGKAAPPGTPGAANGPGGGGGAPAGAGVGR